MSAVTSLADDCEQINQTRTERCVFVSDQQHGCSCGHKAAVSVTLYCSGETGHKKRIPVPNCYKNDTYFTGKEWQIQSNVVQMYLVSVW